MAEFTVFRDSVKRVSPPWLQDHWGYRFMYTLAIQIDATAEALRQGVLARMPGFGTVEALPYIGNDKQILRGPGESNESFIARVQATLTTWKIAGNALSVISQLVGYISPEVARIRYVVTGLDENNNAVADWITVEAGSVTFYRANPSNWDWDGAANNFRWWLIVYPGYGVFDNRKTWGDGHFYGDGTVWGFVGLESIANDFRSMIKKWKCAGTQCLYVILAADNADFDPTGSPGFPLPDGDWDEGKNRLRTALYIPGGGF